MLLMLILRAKLCKRISSSAQNYLLSPIPE